MKLLESIKKQMIFVLEDDNEVMTSALDGDLDKENKRLNKLLIAENTKLLNKINQDKLLTKKDLQLISDANQIYVNDTINQSGFYKKAVELQKWITRQ